MGLVLLREQEDRRNCENDRGDDDPPSLRNF